MPWQKCPFPPKKEITLLQIYLLQLLGKPCAFMFFGKLFHRIYSYHFKVKSVYLNHFFLFTPDNFRKAIIPVTPVPENFRVC